MNPAYLWWLSCQAHKRRLRMVARLLKAINFVVFHAVLPPEADIQRDIELKHYGLGIVAHPNVTLGHRVCLHHHVTLAAEAIVGSEHRIFIEDDVMIGAVAVIVGKGSQSLRIGKGARRRKRGCHPRRAARSNGGRRSCPSSGNAPALNWKRPGVKVAVPKPLPARTH